MFNEFKKYDKESQRTIYIKTETYNKILANANASVRVVSRDVELHNQYNAYCRNCEIDNETPLCEYDYEKKYFMCSCSFETYENAPATLLMSKALDVMAISVKYAKDYYGRQTDDELEVRYHIA